MDITLAGAGINYTPNDDELGRVSLEFAAFDGEVGAGQLPVPDQAAALTIAGGRAALVAEGATVLTDGFLLDQDRVRGPVPVGTAREHNFGVVDANALLGGFRVTRRRRSETDVARVLAFAALDGPDWDTTMVINASTVTMPAKRYDGTGWDELVTDTVEFTGKTMFLHDKAGGGRCLHYHTLTSGHTCGLTISDVIADVDGVTTFYPQSPTRQRTSVDLINDVKGRDQAGRTARSVDSASVAAHDVDGLQHSALIDFDTNSQTDLNVKTAAFLASQKNEQDTWTCAIGPLDEAALALIRVGDLITTTSSVMGLTASAQRIAHMTLTVDVGQNGRARPGYWWAALELGAPIRRRARVKPSTRSLGIIVPTDPINTDDDGSAMVCFQIPDDWIEGTPIGYDPMTISYDGAYVTFTADAADDAAQGAISQSVTLPTPQGTGELRGTVTLPVQGVSLSVVTIDIIVDDTFSPRGGQIGQSHNAPHPVTLESYVEGAANGVGSSIVEYLTPLSGIFNYAVRVESSQTLFKLWPVGYPEPTTWEGPGTAASPDEVRIIVTVVSTGTGVPLGADYAIVFGPATWCYPTDDPVAYAGEMYGPAFVATADGSTSAFTLPLYPGNGYVPGTLDPRIDGIPQPATPTDPAAGTFDFGVNPMAGDTITAVWRVPAS